MVLTDNGARFKHFMAQSVSPAVVPSRRRTFTHHAADRGTKRFPHPARHNVLFLIAWRCKPRTSRGTSRTRASAPSRVATTGRERNVRNCPRTNDHGPTPWANKRWRTNGRTLPLPPDSATRSHPSVVSGRAAGETTPSAWRGRLCLRQVGVHDAAYACDRGRLCDQHLFPMIIANAYKMANTNFPPEGGVAPRAWPKYPRKTAAKCRTTVRDGLKVFQPRESASVCFTKSSPSHSASARIIFWRSCSAFLASRASAWRFTKSACVVKILQRCGL